MIASQEYRRLDPWRIPLRTPAVAFLSHLEGILSEHERVRRLRKRARRAADLARWREMLSAVACDLAWLLLAEGQPGGVTISVSYRNGPLRYRNPNIGKCLPRLLRLLAETDLATVTKDPGPRGMTQCVPSSRMAALIRAFGVRRADIGRSRERSDPLVLTRTIKQGRFKERRWVDYAETEEAALLRSEVDRINAYLASADIAFVCDGGPVVDVRDRWVNRRFVVREDERESFTRCGRLFGGFFQNLPKERRKSIRINGEPVVTLDYSSAFARIALAEHGEAPEGDLYAIPGTETLTRSQIKAAMSAFFFASPGMTTWPRDFQEFGANGEDPISGIPPEWSPKTLKAAILASYPSLGPAFAEGAGDRLMLRESQIMVRLLLSLSEAGLVGLPVHDALIVPRSQALRIAEQMGTISLYLAGASIPVTSTL